MSKQGKFMIFCAEQYKAYKNLNGKQLSILFSTYNVWEYIYTCYGALHTTGVNYIIQDIDGYIKDIGEIGRLRNANVEYNLLRKY